MATRGSEAFGWGVAWGRFLGYEVTALMGIRGTSGDVQGGCGHTRWRHAGVRSAGGLRPQEDKMAALWGTKSGGVGGSAASRKLLGAI